MKFIALDKYLVRHLATNIQMGRVVSISHVNDINQFAVVFKGPPGTLAKKYPDCVTRLEPSKNYKIFLSTRALDDVSKVVCNIIGLTCGETFIDRKAHKILALYEDLKANKGITHCISKAREDKIEDWIIVCIINSFLNKK